MENKDKEVPQELLEKASFEEFQAECNKVLAMKDEEIKTAFADKTVDEVRAHYKKFLDSVTNEDFDAQKLKFRVLELKKRGVAMFKDSKYDEALGQYDESLSILSQVKDKTFAEDTDTALRLNMALVYMKQKNFAKVVSTAEPV